MGNSQSGGPRVIEDTKDLFEYSKNVRPPHKPVPATNHPAKLHEEKESTKDIPLDLSSSLGLDYPASCPNLLSGYIHINPDDSFKQDCVLTCTSLCFHNAVALDLVTYAPKGKCYTLIGDELNEDGSIRSPTRLDWESGGSFTTPLGMWHSHHNESEDEDAWILPVQDAGLALHQGLYDIRFAEEEWKHVKDEHAIKGIIY
ncbi:unnamed protein product [Rotaria sordida]|uniref:Uncharacterized protein n=1 Tax=Rotaria sordida TaxID=392033 RepID=A0A815JIX7_9BILA|nr:unnamed protein product [Rotaria sordida]